MYNAVSSADKTPTGAVPTLLIEATVAGSVVFSAYSDGSSFVRADQPVKIMLKEDSPTVLRAVIEWGGNGLIGKTQARETAAYVITLVNVFGEESGPSLPVVVTKDYLQVVTIGYTLDGSISQYVPCTKIRFYKTVAGAGSDYFMTDEIAFTASPGSFTETLSSNAIASIGPTLESTTRVPPPTDCKGALVTGFGSILLWRANELWPSEMYRGHAFSPDYVVTFPNNIVTVRSTAFGILVWTTAGVYIVNGSNPRALLPVRLPVRQTVVNDLAIAVYENTVIYASPDGLVVIQGSDASLGGFLKIMTRQQWRSRYSARFSSLVLAAHDGYIVGLFSSGDGFLIRMDEDVGDFVEHSITGLGAFYFPQTDQLYIGGPSGIKVYNEGVPLSWQWYSKEFRVGKPVNMGAFEACGYGAMIVVLLGDDVVLATFAITLSTKGTLQRLPTGNKCQHYRLQFNALAGSILTSFRLCEIPAELAGV